MKRSACRYSSDGSKEMTEELYPVSPDVLKLNQGKGLVARTDNPINAVRDLSPEKLKALKKQLSGNSETLKESESEFQSWLIALAKLKGFKVAHFRGGWSKDGKQYNTPVQGHHGFFDVVMAKNGVIIICELKSEKGKLSPEQKEWFHAMNGDGVATTMVFVWRPSDRERIMGILS